MCRGRFFFGQNQKECCVLNLDGLEARFEGFFLKELWNGRCRCFAVMIEESVFYLFFCYYLSKFF